MENIISKQLLDDDFVSNSEPEAIFKACEWILGNKEPNKWQ